MPAFFQRRFQQRIRTQEARSFGVTVQLQRGPDRSAAFVATIEVRHYEIIGEDDKMTVVRMRDYLFDASNAVINSLSVEPRAGDRIIEAGGIYEVVPLGTRPAAELEPAEYRYRVHTNQVTS